MPDFHPYHLILDARNRLAPGEPFVGWWVAQIAMESDRKGVTEHLQNSGITEFSMTDEYFPIFIANALALVGENDEALVWLKRAVDWGFSNYKFLAEGNEFLKPLKNDHRFQTLIEKARQQQEGFFERE